MTRIEPEVYTYSYLLLSSLGRPTSQWVEEAAGRTVG